MKQSPLLHVFRTYWTRPLNIVLTCGVLAMLVFQWSVGIFNHYTQKIAPRLSAPGRSESVSSGDLATLARRTNPKIVQSLLVTEFRSKPISGFSQFPELRYVQLNVPEVSPTTLAALEHLPHLRSLSLITSRLPKNSLMALAGKLEQLEIPSHLLKEHANELRHLKHLQLLITDSSELNAKSLAAVATIPHLKYLVLTAGYGLSRYVSIHRSGRLFPDREAFEPLWKHSELKGVFANRGIWRLSQFRTFSRTRAFPESYFNRMSYGVTLAAILMLGLTAILSLQLGAQFTLPAAQLLPGYAPPHRRVAVYVLSCGIILCTTGQMLCGISILPAVAFNLFYPACVACLALLTQRPGKIRNIAIAVWMILCILFPYWQVSFMLLPPELKGRAIRFLEGTFSGWAVVVLIFEMSALWLVFRRLPVLGRAYVDTGRKDPLFQPWMSQSQVQAVAAKNQGWHIQQWSLISSQTKSCPFVFHNGSFWEQVRLWRKGNPPRLRFIVLLILLILFFGLFSQLRRIGSLGPTHGYLIESIFVQMTMVALIFPMIFWFRRCKNLEQEFLRPVIRKDLVRQLFCGLALDQSIALIPAAAWIIYMIMFPHPGRSVEEIYAHIPLVLLSLLFGYAVSCGVFAVKRAWVFFTALLGFIALPFFGVMIFVIVGRLETLSQADSFRLMIGLTLLAGLDAIGLIALFYRMTLRREWG